MRIVIVGGGVAGHLVAHATQHTHEVVLVEPRDHLVVPIAMPRALVEPAVAERALVPYAEFLPAVEHVQGRAVRVTPDTVTVETTEGERTVQAEAIVLATGSSYRREPALFPAIDARAARLAEAASFAERLEAAEHVLIVGGGPVGVEVAAEILTDVPDTRVTLVHSGPRLLPGTSDRAGELALRWLVDHGADVLLDDRLDLPGFALGHAFEGTTDGGVFLKADLCLRFVGYRPDLDYLDLGDVLDAHGRVRVRPTLQVDGHDRVLALGDITDLPERKMAMYAAKHAKVAVRTLDALASGQTPTATYRPGTGEHTMLVTLGRRDGVASLPFGTVAWPWLARWLKSDDVMVGKYRGRVGLE